MKYSRQQPHAGRLQPSSAACAHRTPLPCRRRFRCLLLVRRRRRSLRRNWPPIACRPIPMHNADAQCRHKHACQCIAEPPSAIFSRLRPSHAVASPSPFSLPSPRSPPPPFPSSQTAIEQVVHQRRRQQLQWRWQQQTAATTAATAAATAATHGGAAVHGAAVCDGTSVCSV